MHPDSGTIAVGGPVAPLMSLGAGLEPELTGRENIHLVATLIGLSKSEIKNAIGNIIAFSELSTDEIDMQVKRYSSGMISRLAFSIAVANTPEILIIDEALAVGDLGFRQKCGRRINEIKEHGSTILYVSHHYEELKSICSRAVLLENGGISADGSVDDIFHLYEKSLLNN
jgi:ABC-type polysaccharide/polyol phosphate transport system ATPase subunit